MRRLLSYVKDAYYSIVSAGKWLMGVGGGTKIPKGVYQFLHLLIIATIAILLAVFSTDIISEADISGSNPIVKRYFCGILFLMLYAFTRLVMFVIRLFMMEEESPFPDIDEAWSLGMQGLAAEGLDLHMLPTFLIVGLKQDEEESFFAGARFGATVNAPKRDEGRMPLRFYANREALFISCPGVSTMCRQLAALPVFSTSSGQTLDGQQPDEATLAPGKITSEHTLRPDDVAAAGTLQPGQAASAQTLQPGQMAASQTLAPGMGGLPVGQQPPPRAVSLSSGEMSECRRRMNYLCRLLNNNRAPFCPINGLLLSIPLRWSQSTNPGAFDALKQDVGVLHHKLQLLFPVVCLFTGLNELDGLKEFIERSGEVDSRFGVQLRAGSHYPIGRAVDAKASQWVVNQGIEWFRRWIYSAFAKNLDSKTNTKLYRLLCDLDERRGQLGNLLRSTFSKVIPGHEPRFVGGYYCGIDAEKKRHVFVKDVVDKLIGEQDKVAWTSGKMYRDYQCRAWSRRLYAVIGLLAVVDVYLLWRWLFA